MSVAHPERARWWRGFTGWASRHTRFCVVLGLLLPLLAANGAYVTGQLDPNPLGPRSYLAYNAVSPARDVAPTINGPSPGYAVLDLNDGFTSQALGHRSMLDWLHLHVPWWDPYEGTGAPLVAEMAGAGFFPPTLLTLSGNGQLFERLLLEFWAGLATYLLLRRLGLSRLACLAGGVAYELNGTFAWFSHAPINPIPLLPTALLGIEVAFSAAQEGRRGGWRWLAVAGALSFLAGFPETTYLDSLLVVCWGIWRCACLPRPAVTPYLKKLTAGAAVAILVALPLIVAFGDYLGSGNIGGHGGGLNGQSAPTRELSMLLMPYVYGPGWAYADPGGTMSTIWRSVGGYLDTSLLLFALVGLCSRSRRPLKLVLAAFVVVALSRIYRVPPGVGHLFDLLPGMDQVTVIRYLYPALELAVVVLCACGLDALREAASARARAAAAGTLALLALLALALLAHPLTLQLPGGHGKFSKGSLLWAGAVVLAGSLIILLPTPRRRLVGGAAIVMLDAIALFALATLSSPAVVRVDLRPVSYLREHLGLQRFFSLGPLHAAYGAYFGLGELNVADQPIPTNYTRFVTTRLDPYTDPTEFPGNNWSGRSPTAPSTISQLISRVGGYRDAGVAYIVGLPGTRLPTGRGMFTLVSQSPAAWIYRLSGSRPYFTAGPGCRTGAQRRTSVTVTCSSASTLVRRETYMAGWSARVDGRPSRIGQTEGLFQQVRVPAGTHTVTFDFTPPGETPASVGFLIGLLVLVVPAGVARATCRRTIPALRAAQLSPSSFWFRRT